VAEKKIIVEFREKGRRAQSSELMTEEDAVREYERVVRAWEEVGPGSNQIIRVGKTLTVRGSQIANVKLASPAVITSIPLG
jgi:hypothetical protein